MTSIYSSYIGMQPYRSVWNFQEELRKKILDGSGGATLLLVQHPPTVSLGRGEKGVNLNMPRTELEKNGFDVVESNRGGKVTYHGPGQLVAYPIVDLRMFKMGVKQFVHALEETMIQMLRIFKIPAERREGCPGAWVNGKKIGSIGIHVRKQVSIHGLALNVEPNLEHFGVMTPCGISDIQMTSMKNEGVAISVENILPSFVETFSQVFGCEIVAENLAKAANV